MFLVDASLLEMRWDRCAAAAGLGRGAVLDRGL